MTTQRRRRPFLGLALALLLPCLAMPVPAAAPPSGGPQAMAPTPVALQTVLGTLLERAQPDECYAAATDSTNYGAPPCTAPLRPKTNQAYVWGLAKVGNDIWFGTMANTECAVLGGYLGMTTPFETPSYACQFGSSWYAQGKPPMFAAIGDTRPPHIYVYNLATQSLTDKRSALPLPAQAALDATLGLRAAGAFNGTVILAGPSLVGGINMFAFNAATGSLVGFANLPAYNNVRKLEVISDGFGGQALYAGVGMPNPTNDPTLKTGRVLRWVPQPPLNLLNFVEVGVLDSMASELTAHEGRIFVTTWPDSEMTVNGKLAGLYMSPPLAAGGLQPPAAEWERVWSITDYEPDPVTAMTVGGGALASYGGYLWWGTMHVPLLSTLAHMRAYADFGPEGPAEQLSWFLQSERAIEIFRGRDFASAPQIDLAYGQPVMPVYVQSDPLYPGGWEMTSNAMGAMPLFGPSGFGNPFNNYTWTMQVFDGRLWVGTMDWGMLFNDTITQFLPISGLPTGVGAPAEGLGADLFFFANPEFPALPEDIRGVGNPANYGIRTMVADADGLFLGMANPMNLLTDPAGPRGGWELIRLRSMPPNTPAGTGVTVPVGGGATVTFCQVEQAGYTTAVAFALPTAFWGLLPVPPPLMPLQVFLMGSSADYRQCSEGALVRVCVPRRGVSSPHLLALSYEPADGLRWRDITAEVTDDSVCGFFNPHLMGVIVLAQDTRVPALQSGGLIALMALLALAGALLVRRIG